MIPLNPDRKKMLGQCLELIEACRASQATRAAWCRLLSTITETGRQDGTRSLINKLYNHLDRLSAHLFSPTDLRFTIDFENPYPPNILAQAAMASKIITREFERSNADMTFARGVFESLKYGAAILKQWPHEEGEDRHIVYNTSIVEPWQFGVYREDMNDLGKQEALCETAMLTMPEVWRRIWHLPDAEKLFSRIKTHAQRGETSQENSFFHQVLSTSQLQTGVDANTRPIPGGIMQMASNPNYASVAPVINVDTVKFHELWVKGEDDYVTVQIVEPDIIVAPAPGFKLSNILIGGDVHTGRHPYTLVQPNEVQGYFWGRSEISDLIEPQDLLSVWADDVKRLFGLQIDKILAFTGFDGLSDETYDQMRGAGFFSGQAGGNVTDLTPKFPPESIPMLQFVISIIDSMGGFDNILAGKGEPGVRAGSHAQTLLKTASPRLRDRSLLVERQCANAADLRLAIMEAKEGKNYWTDGSSEEAIEKTSFKLDDLPEDRRVSVDSHSGSPIFADDHAQLIFAGLQAQYIDGHSAIELLPYPQKDILLQRLKEREEKQAQLIQQHPELIDELAKHRAGRRR